MIGGGWVLVDIVEMFASVVRKRHGLHLKIELLRI
jgi:hypothetical protein